MLANNNPGGNTPFGLVLVNDWEPMGFQKFANRGVKGYSVTTFVFYDPTNKKTSNPEYNTVSLSITVWYRLSLNRKSQRGEPAML
jgi:hypothetical protein